MPYQPRATLDNPYGPQVTFRTEDVLPPSALYLSMDDTVVLLLQTNTAGSVVTAILRLLTPQGEVKIESYPSPPLQALGAYNYITVPPAECYLLSLLVLVNMAQQGSIWCQCFVIRGQFSPPYSTTPPYGGMLIVQGYLNDYGALSWPNSPIIEPGTGAGSMRNIRLTAAPGTSWVMRVPSLTRWEIITVSSQLNTSAATQQREMSLITLDQSGNPMCRFPMNFLQGPSVAISYFFYNSAAQLETGAGWATAPIPSGLTLDSNWQLQSSVAGLDVADAWSFVAVNVREWVGIATP